MKNEGKAPQNVSSPTNRRAVVVNLFAERKVSGLFKRQRMSKKESGVEKVRVGLKAGRHQSFSASQRGGNMSARGNLFRNRQAGEPNWES